MFKLLLISISLASSNQLAPDLSASDSERISYTEDTHKRVLKVVATDGTQFVFDMKHRQQIIVHPDNSVEMRSMDAGD